MPTLDEIVKQIENLDGTSSVLRRKGTNELQGIIRELPGILHNDEKIEKIAGGFYSNRLGIIVATDQRFLFVNPSAFSDTKVTEFPYEQMDSVQYNKALIFCGLYIYSQGKRAEITGIKRALAGGIFEFIQSKISPLEERGADIEQKGGSMDSPTLDEVVKQIENLDGTRHVLKRKEIKELPGILRNNEKIEKIAGGGYTYEVSYGIYEEQYGIIVATDQRFLCVRKSTFFGLKVRELLYEKMIGVDYDRGLMLGGLQIYLPPGDPIRITKVDHALARGIFEFIQSKISSSKER